MCPIHIVQHQPSRASLCLRRSADSNGHKKAVETQERKEPISYHLLERLIPKRQNSKGGSFRVFGEGAALCYVSLGDDRVQSIVFGRTAGDPVAWGRIHQSQIEEQGPS